MEQTKRIVFIDLVKGICILLVVASHIGGIFDEMDQYHMIASFRMPLYFFITGIFFKSYEGLFGFFIRKVNKLLIPFAVFYVGGWIGKWLVATLISGVFQKTPQLSDLLVIFEKHTLIDYNPPIWFLVALFNCSLLFYVVHFLRHRMKLMLLLACAIGVVGFTLGKLRIELPLYIDVAMTALPFYAMGFWIRRFNFFLQPSRFDKYIPLIIPITLFVLYEFASVPGMRTNHYSGNIVQFYVAGTAGILTIMLIGKFFRSAPIISYLGRYSVITLCVHAFFQTIFIRFLPKYISNLWIYDFTMLFLLVGLSILSTPILVRVMPQFVAQKEMFKPELLLGINNFVRRLVGLKPRTMTMIDDEEDAFGENLQGTSVDGEERTFDQIMEEKAHTDYNLEAPYDKEKPAE